MTLRFAAVVVFLACLSTVNAATTSPAAGPPTQRVAAIVEPLLRGRDRIHALQTLGQTVASDPTLLNDPHVFAAFAACADDPDPRIRLEAARTIGQVWIWGRQPQNLQAIELEKKLARDADPSVVHYAVYFGLSTADDKTDDVIRATFDAAAAAKDYDPINLHGRIAWGLRGTPAERLLPLCEPYWEKRDENPLGPWMIYRLFVEITGEEPPDAQRFDAIKAKLAEAEAAQKHANEQRLPALAKSIREGDSAQRREAMREIYVTKFLLQQLDEAVLDALCTAADDPDPRVRKEIARVSGQRWVWSAPEQSTKAIELALRLQKDPVYDVRHFAVYFGLSTVRDPSDEVIRALIESSIIEHDHNTTGRAAWGLQNVEAERLLPLFEPYFANAAAKPTEAAQAAKLYTAITGGPPPRAAEMQAVEAQANSYASVFKELFDHLARVYPTIEAKQIDWTGIGKELLPKAAEVKDDRDFGLLCLQLVARLEDSHAQLLPGTAPLPTIDFPQFDPGFACLIDDRDRPVVYHVDRNSPAEQAGVKVGMTVVSVNGIPADDAIKAWMDRQRKYVGYSSERYLRYDAAKGFCRTMNRSETVKLELQDAAGEKHQFELPATLGIRYLPRLPVPIHGVNDSGDVEAKRLGDGIGYVYVRRIRADLPESLDAALKQLGEIKGLIIDVRGNSGGGFDASRALRNFDPDDPAEPDRPRYGGPIALLLDERCISAGEGWASWFIAKHRARTFGTTTAGASSRKQEYALTNGLYKVIVPVKAYTGFLDRPIERRGLEPDVEIRCNAADLATGRDTVLEAAKRWLKESAATEPASPPPAAPPASD